MKQRIAYVDAAKGISILMIAMGHITDYGNPLDTWMSSFKVSIFYIISGFLMSYSQSVKKRNFSVYVSKLSKSLVIPYISFSVIGILSKTLKVVLKHKDTAKIIKVFREYALDSIFLKGINSMWFLPTIFIGEIIFFWLIRSPKVIKGLYAVLALFSLRGAVICEKYIVALPAYGHHITTGECLIRLLHALSKGITAAWFLGAGYIIYKLYRHIKERHIKFIIGVSFTVLNVILSQINSGVDFNLLDAGQRPYLFYICGIIGSIGAIALLDFISSYARLTFLNYWGKNSLIVMCTHTVLGIRTILYNGWGKYAYMPKEGNLEYLFACFMVLVIMMMVEYSLVEIINTRFPFLIGKQKVVKVD